MEYLMAFFIVGACFFLLSVGVIFAQKRLGGNCGGNSAEAKEDDPFECGVCPKKEAEICESGDEEGLARLAQLGYPNKQ